jgi:hypothetical protein
MHDLMLPGLDGTNPLGFFAALGVLRALTDSGSDARLAWGYSAGWRAVVVSEHPDSDGLVAILDADRRLCLSDPALALAYDNKRDLKPAPATFRRFLAALAADAVPGYRRSVDWAAAFASDVVVDNNGNTKPTAFHFTAGQQQFLQMANDLASQVSVDDLREALDGPWRYNRPLPVLGWDATVSRDYALRASDPSTDKKLGVPGADWLALRGLTFFPVFPRGQRLLTTGCKGGWKDGSFTWPLWTSPLPPCVVGSVVGLNVGHMSRLERQAHSIGAVFVSRIKRSDQGGYGAFEPAAIA